MTAGACRCEAAECCGREREVMLRGGCGVTYPIPVEVLTRLAVDNAYQGRGIGRGLLRDAAMRVLAAAGQIGIRGLVVHAVSEEAKAFYLNFGLLPSPVNE